MKDFLCNILSKLASGRYILTVIAGVVFFVLSIKSILPTDKIQEILLMVFVLYFTRADRQKGETK